MANRFDFQLTADDQVSQSIQNIDDAVKNLLPQLNKARTGLKLGGRESVEDIDEISGRFGNLAKNARDGVQFVGDLVPPLKMVGGLTLGLSGLAAGINAVKNGIKDYANAGYKIDTTSKNISTTARAYQELTGAMIENGATRDAADSAVTGLYQRANDAVQGRDNGFVSFLAQLGIKVNKTKEGVADVVTLMDDLNKAMQKQSPAKQAVIAQVGGFSPDLLNFLRQSTEQVQRLKDQAQRDGLIFSDQDVQNALKFRQNINQISSAWDGMLMKGEAWLGQSKTVKKSFDDASQIMKHGLDSATVGSLMTWNRGGEQADRLREAQGNDDFKSTLSFKEKMDLRLGYASPDLVKKLNGYYGPTDKANQLQQDVKGLYVNPPATVNPGGVTSLKPGSKEAELFPQLEAKYKLPQGTLNNVYQAESGGGKYLLSPAGAEGPFQFMASTGEQYGLKNREDRMDLGKSAEAAAHYLSDLLGQFGGDMKKAVASYNWGPGRVGRLGLDYAPKETRDYLDRVMPGLPDFHDVSDSDSSNISMPVFGEQPSSQISDDNSMNQPSRLSQDNTDRLSNGRQTSDNNSINQAARPSEGSIDRISKNSLTLDNTSTNQDPISGGENINSVSQKNSQNAEVHIDTQKIADALTSALKESDSKLEVTFINGQTGSRHKATGRGGKVIVAMPLP